MEKLKTDQLIKRVESLIKKENGYMFSDEDRALLEEILTTLKENPENPPDIDDMDGRFVKVLTLVIKLLEFFDIDSFSDFL